MYKQAKEFDSAALVYEQAIEKYEQDTDLLQAEVVPELYYELGLMYEEMGRYTEAAEAFQKSIATIITLSLNRMSQVCGAKPFPCG